MIQCKIYIKTASCINSIHMLHSKKACFNNRIFISVRSAVLKLYLLKTKYNIKRQKKGISVPTNSKKSAVHKMEQRTKHHSHMPGVCPHHPHGDSKVEYEYKPVHHEIVGLRHS